MLLHFSVANNKFGVEGAKLLAEALHVNSSMKNLNLADNDLCGAKYKYIGGTYDPAGIKAIADALSVSTSMTSLNVADNSLGRYYNGSKWVTDMAGIKAIADALSVSTSMTSLK